MRTAPATAAATDAEEWISRADAAKLARCSEATINRAVEKHGLETTTGSGGRVMVRLADLVRVGRIKPEDIPTGATAAGTAELRRTQEQLVVLAPTTAAGFRRRPARHRRGTAGRGRPRPARHRRRQ